MCIYLSQIAIRRHPRGSGRGTVSGQFRNRLYPAAVHHLVVAALSTPVTPDTVAHPADDKCEKSVPGRINLVGEQLGSNYIPDASSKNRPEHLNINNEKEI